MRLDIRSLRAGFLDAQRGKRSRHEVRDRTSPTLWQYDYLTLSTLSRDVAALVAEVPPPPPGAVALDLGCDKSPYRELLETSGYAVRTLDVSPDSGADYVGTVEATGLGTGTFDLILCTQVLEHCTNPWDGAREIGRIVKPGGHVLLSAPHVWFYHPHPTDHWRFTQEGMLRLCQMGGLTPLVLIAQGGVAVTVCQIVNFLAYGVLGRMGAPLYGAMNSIARAVDRFVSNPLFSHNFACLAVRPAVSGPPGEAMTARAAD
jgi:SAM-dependent methyltransferase